MCRLLRVMSLRLKLATSLRQACRFSLRLLAWIPVIIVALVLIWGYYVYVYVMNISGKLVCRRRLTAVPLYEIAHSLQARSLKDLPLSLYSFLVRRLL